MSIPLPAKGDRSSNHGRSLDRREGWVGLKPTARLRMSRGRQERGPGKRTRSLFGLNGEVLKKDLTGPTLLEMNFYLANRTLPLPSTQRICHHSMPQQDRRIPSARFCHLTSPACYSRNRFLRRCSDLPPPAPDFATAIRALPGRTGSAQPRRSIWPNGRLCRCPSASNNQ